MTVWFVAPYGVFRVTPTDAPPAITFNLLTLVDVQPKITVEPWA